MYKLTDKYINVNLSDKEKSDLLNKIISDLVKDKDKSNKLKGYLFVGHPGSFKSSYRNKLLNKNKIKLINSIILDPDDIKLYMPDYKTNININNKRLSSKYNGEKSRLYVWFMNELIEYFIKLKEYNLIIESVCSYIKYCHKIIIKLYQNNYNIYLLGFHNNNLNKVKEYINERFIKTGRYINNNYIEKTHNNNLNIINDLINNNKNIISYYKIKIKK